MQGIDQHQTKDASKLPFHGAVGVDEIIVHSEWVVAWERVSEALATPGVVALVGARGAGKTLFLQTFARELQYAGWDVELVQQGSIARSADPQIILVDEADRLPLPLLQSLAARGRPCVFAGLPALSAHLSELPVHVTTVALSPLPSQEVGSFLGEQLARSNQPHDLLQPDAVVALAHYSGGEPARLQLLAGLAVFMARLEDAPRVSAAHVKAATTVQSGTSLGASDINAEYDDMPGESFDFESEPEPPVAGPPPRIAVASSPPRPWWRAWPVAVLVLAGLTVGAVAAVPIAARLYQAAGGQFGRAQDGKPGQRAGSATHAQADSTPLQATNSVAAPQPAKLTAVDNQETSASGLPMGVPARVLISYRQDSAAAKRRGDDLAKRLRSQGLDVQGPAADASRPAASAVSYFFTNDAPAAARIADEAGEGGREQLLPSPAALPPPGTIQITFAGLASR